MLRRLFIVVTAAASFCAATPASAQVWEFGQGPWNAHAQPSYSRGKVRAQRSYGAPPRNAQCGWYMGRVTGHTDRSLWLAQNWARKFQRTPPAPGRVVVWSRGGNRGHVAKIVAMQSQCRATVHDNRGTYSRDICRGVIAYVRV